MLGFRRFLGMVCTKLISDNVVGMFSIVADQYASTPEGRYEIERAKEEGSKVYVNAREVVLRPGVAGGLLGAVNVAVLGAGAWRLSPPFLVNASR